MRNLVAPLILFSLFAFNSGAGAEPPSRRIATLTDGPWQGAAFTRALVGKELGELAGGEFTPIFPAELQVAGDWSPGSVRARLDGLLADPAVDVIITLGPLGSHFAGRRPRLEHPVIAAAVVDADVQGLPRQGRGSGRPDLTYITDDLDLSRELKAFRTVVPFERLAMLGSPSELEGIPELALEVQRQATEMGLPITLIGVGADPQAAVDAIPADVQAVYVAPLPHLPEAAYRALAEGLIRRGLPSYANRGYPDVEWGMLTTITPPVDVERYMRRIALAAHQILIGEPASGLPVDFERGSQLVINAETARKLDLSPSWKVLTEAEFIGRDEVPRGRALTLTDAVQSALANNRSLIAGRSGVDAAGYAREKARAPLLPTLDAEVSTRLIDADRARASLGQAPQFTGSGKLTLTQLIYNHGAWVNRDIQDDLQRSRAQGFAATELDVVHDTAVAWFDVLRARTAAEIQRATLRLSRQNLATAQTRARLGAGRTVDIHRWQAQIANDQQAVIQAETGVEMAMLVLAQMMGTSLEEPLAPVPITLGDPDFIISRPAFIVRLSTPRGFARFRDFMAHEALANAPELAQIDAALAAAEARTKLARRFWLPTVGLKGEIEQRFFAAGDGVDASDGLTVDPTLAGMLPDGAFTVATADDTNWFVGLSVSVPLYDGGERYSEIREADAQVVDLRHQRAAIAERIEQRVRLAVHQAGTAFPSIELSQEAAVAAGKSRDIALDAYTRGIIDETNLLDVQNTARVSEAIAGNAFYDFLVRLMGVHRAVGAFYFLRAPEAKAAFEERFLEFMDRSDPPAAPPATLPTAPDEENR